MLAASGPTAPGPTASGWADVAEAYDRSFARLCAGSAPSLIDALDPVAGGRILDVGTGTGRIAQALAAAGFTVDASDPEPDMVRFARANRSGPRVTFRPAALPDLAGKPADGAVANFVVNHTPDPRASVRGLARGVRSGGIAVVTVWPTRVSALNALWGDVIDGAGAVRPPAPRLDPALDFERTADGLAALLRGEGWADVDATEISWVYRTPPDDLWAAVPAGIAIIGAVYRAQSSVVRDRMRAEFIRITAPLTRNGDIHLPMTAVLASATSRGR